VLFEIQVQINGMYRRVQEAKSQSKSLQIDLDKARMSEIIKARWLVANFEPFRQKLGHPQRDSDLALMWWMRRASCLSVIIGAGVTIDAGGPSWAELAGGCWWS
jgi:hypothetical protein